MTRLHPWWACGVFVFIFVLLLIKESRHHSIVRKASNNLNWSLVSFFTNEIRRHTKNRIPTGSEENTSHISYKLETFNVSSNFMLLELHCIGYMSMISPESESLYVASNFLLEQLHSHIGRTCKVSPRNEFSNVSSNCRPQQMHCYIGCTCKTFLWSVFSCVSSNFLPEQIHSHIGCICVSLQCEFSDVSSNWGLVERWSCISCTCLISLHSPY